MSSIRGRFNKPLNKTASEYAASISFDWQLYQYDILGSIAHTKMLLRQNIITDKEAEDIIHGLQRIKEEIEQNVFSFQVDLEDIHMNIEARLVELIGATGKKLHTARSRNDQIALDTRLYLKDVIKETIENIISLQKALLNLATANKDVVMPGYTHLQMAQPILFAHHLLAYFEMLQRDIMRFFSCWKETDVMPLGSGAIAGVSYNIDRMFLAQELGFNQISKNSIDAVSDRDFIISYEAAASLCMMHLSRLAEEIIIWSSTEFDFVKLDDAFATPSSIMPQKKNPDITELARGKTGRVYGHLMALLTTMKGLPLAYNRDMQEDKQGLFDTIDTVLSTLVVMSGLINSLQIKPEKMAYAVKQGYLLATDIADLLVKKGEPFRKAHDIVSQLVNYAIQHNKTFHELSLQEYKNFSPFFDSDIYTITIESSIAARNVTGGTAPNQVHQAIAQAKKITDDTLLEINKLG